MVTKIPTQVQTELGWGRLESAVWRRLACNRVSDSGLASALLQSSTVKSGCMDGPQFSSLASPPALCYQRHFLKRAFRKTGRITK